MSKNPWQQQRRDSIGSGSLRTSAVRVSSSAQDEDSMARSRYEARESHDRVPGRFPRIAKPVERIKESYECVVIGSGYGGSVAASRMARAGQSVCVLERGQEKWPGEYPVSFREVAAETRCTGHIAPGFATSWGIDHGKHNGLFQLMLGQGQGVLSCAGMSCIVCMHVCMCIDHEVSRIRG